MDLGELRKLIKCASPRIRSEPIIYAGCLESSMLLTRILDKLNVPYQRAFGTVETSQGEQVHHCWLEVGDVVLETNPSQVLGLPAGALAMEKSTWQELSKAKPEADIFPQRFEPTPAGKQFYDKAAESIIRCFKGKEDKPKWVDSKAKNE